MKGNRMWNRILAVLLAVSMVFGSNTMTSLAANSVVVGLVNDKKTETEPQTEETLAETELESESDAITSAEGTEGTETELSTEVEPGSEQDTEAESEPQVPAETEPGTELESEPQVPAETELDTELESESQVPAETELESESQTSAETELDTEAESESELLTPAETESESETEAEIVTTTQDVDGTMIEVSYPADAFEEEVTLQATAITEGGQQYEEVKDALDELQENDESFSYGTFVAFDITFLSVATGEEVEPLKEISVSIKLSEEQQPEETENTNLVHIPEESGKAEVVENAQISADATEVTFQNDEFSPFVLTLGNQKIAVDPTEMVTDPTTEDETETMSAVISFFKTESEAATEDAVPIDTVTVEIPATVSGTEGSVPEGNTSENTGTDSTTDEIVEAPEGSLAPVTFANVLSQFEERANNQTYKGLLWSQGSGESSAEISGEQAVEGDMKVWLSKITVKFYSEEPVVEETLSENGTPGEEIADGKEASLIAEYQADYGTKLSDEISQIGTDYPEYENTVWSLSGNRILTDNKEEVKLWPVENAVTVISADGSEKYFSTLKGAVDDAAAGSTVRINRDLTDADEIGSCPVTISKALTIDLNNKALDANGKKGILYINFKNVSDKNAVITVKDGILTGSCASTAPSINDKSALQIDGIGDAAENKVILDGVTIKGNKGWTGGGIHISKGVAVTMKGCTVSDNAAKQGGGGIYCEYPNYSGDAELVLNLENTKVNNNAILDYISWPGGGIYGKGQNVKITLTDSLVSSNRAKDGGGIYVQEGSLTLNSGAVISDNLAYPKSSNGSADSGHGGGIYLEKATSFSATGARILNNTSRNQGGGIYAYENDTTSFVMRDSFVLNNKLSAHSGGTSAYGGGIYIVGSGEAEISGGEIAGNEAKPYEGKSTQGTSYGGGVYFSGSKLTMRNVVVNGNEASSSVNKGKGGGIYCESATEGMEINDTTVSGNKATSGGGMYLSMVDTILSNVTVTGNIAAGETKTKVNAEGKVTTAGYGGGGIFYQYAGSGKTLTIKGGNISGNTSASSFGHDLMIDYNTENGNGLTDGLLALEGVVSISGDKLSDTQGSESDEESDNGSTEVGAGIGIVLKEADFKGINPETPTELICVKGAELPEEFISKIKVAGNPGTISREGDYLVIYKAMAVYLNSSTGKDTNDGLTEKTAVRTYEHAEELLSDILQGGKGKYTTGTIYLTQPIKIKKDEKVTWPSESWNKDWKLVLSKYDQFSVSNYMINVNAGGTLILGGERQIDITGSSDTGFVAKRALINVASNGKLVIQDGATIRNGANESDQPNSGGGAIYSKGTIEMTGGSITENEAYLYGGGIQLSGGILKLSGGVISENKAKKWYQAGDSFKDEKRAQGGGIAAFDGATIEMSGGTVKDNTSGGSAGGIALANLFTNTGVAPVRFTMTGGKIEHNTARTTGGGLYVECTNSAEISNGEIINNTLGNYGFGDYGGAGIYVNGGKGSYENGKLHLTNVVVTDNTTGDYKGSGLSACWTSEVTIHLLNGGAIYGNNGGNCQVYINKAHVDGGVDLNGPDGLVDISYFMLGGGAYGWQDINGNYIPLNMMHEAYYRNGYYLKNKPSEYALSLLKTYLSTCSEKVIISGNVAERGGGGIGTNGSVEIGDSEDTKALSVRKNWAEEDKNKLYYRSALDNVKAWLLQKTGTDPEIIGNLEFNEHAYFNNNPSGKYEWQPKEWKDEVTFEKLPVSAEYLILEEYILTEPIMVDQGDGKEKAAVTHVWSADGKAYKSVVDKIMGSTPYIWSDDVDAYYDSTAQSDSNGGYTVTNTPAVAVDLEAKKIYKTVEKELHLTGGKFSFTATQVDESGETVLKDDGTPVYEETVTNEEGGKVTFPRKRFVYNSEEGGNNTYYFQIKENAGENKGITYDPATYTVKVELKFNDQGKLEAVSSVSKGEEPADAVTFENTYKASGQTEITASKTLTGHALAEGQFSFMLTQVDENGNTLLTENEDGEQVPAYEETVTNAADGSVTFTALEYTEADDGKTYYYQVTEKAAGASGYTYDGSVYTVAVAVTDNGDGTLNVEQTVTKDDEAVNAAAFANTYEASGQTEITASKTLTGHDLAEGQFSFTLTQVDENGNTLLTENEDGEQVPAYEETVTNAADGSVTFKALEYTEADAGETYYYQVAEEAAGASGYTYDGSVYTVAVAVTDNGDGTMKAEQTVMKDGETAESIAFANTYTASGQTEITASKTLTGHDLAEGQFSFTLTQVDENGNTLLMENEDGEQVPTYEETVTNAADGSVTFKALEYTEADAGETYYYQVAEEAAGAEGYTYDGSVYTVAVAVTDNGDGTMKAEQAVTKDGAAADAIAFANTFAGSVTLTKRSEASTPENPELLAGAEFQLYYRADGAADGTQYGEAAYVTGADGTLTVDGLPAGDYYFVETQAPAGYVTATGADGSQVRYPFTIGGEQAVVHAALDVTNAPEPEPQAAELTVTKQLAYENELWNAVDETFYVALYSDEDLTDRVTDIQPIVFRNSNTSSTTFTGLEYGRAYYVGETNDDGVVLNTMGGVIASGQSFSVDFNEGNTATLTRENGTQVITFRNVFEEIPPAFYREGTLTVTKRLLGADGVEKAADRTFYAGIFSDASYTQLSSDVDQNIVELALNGSSTVTATVTVTVPQGGSMTVYVTEVDRDGRPVEGAASFQYDVTVEGATITMDEENLSGETVITNQEREEETEEETELETESIKKDKDDGDEIVPATTSSVKTGDETPLGLYIGLMAAAAALILLLFAVRRKRGQK